jgi:hypothetical protein
VKELYSSFAVAAFQLVGQSKASSATCVSVGQQHRRLLVDLLLAVTNKTLLRNSALSVQAVTVRCNRWTRQKCESSIGNAEIELGMSAYRNLD